MDGKWRRVACFHLIRVWVQGRPAHGCCGKGQTRGESKSTFRQLGLERYNILVEQSVSSAKTHHCTFDKERWNKAVCKGRELLYAGIGLDTRTI
jgi:hypothetical protein